MALDSGIQAGMTLLLLLQQSLKPSYLPGSRYPMPWMATLKISTDDQVLF
jgi:hypothetical protein